MNSTKPYEHLIEHRLDHTEVYKGSFLHAFRDTVTLPDGKTTVREYLKHPCATMVIPIRDDGRLIVERQYRYPVQQVMIEFPAGKLDPEENALDCARRELREETGYQASEWAHAGVLHSGISTSTEFIDIWFARGLSPGTRELDAGEFLDVFDASLEELLEWARLGLLTDAKTLTGLLWLQNHLNGSWKLDWHSVPPTP
ncbi:MAG: NUDIX hydrolase [Limnohabitans sp.]|nr:NUDIX hydrolase [Limnohabitans sp.]